MKEQKVVLNGLSIHATITGNPEGQPIIFLHAASLSSGMWKPQLEDPDLQRYELITFDFPGHGNSQFSTDAPVDYSFKGLARTLVEFIGFLKPNNFLLVGSSLGTNVIGEAIPELKGCKGIMLAGPTILNDQLSPDKVLLSSPYGHVSVTPVPSEDDVDNFAAMVLSKQFFHYGKSAFLATDPSYRTVLGNDFITGAWSDQINNLRQARIPMCIVQGKRESIAKPGYLEKAGLYLWQKKIHFLDEAGHMVNLDDPAGFNPILSRFAYEAFNSISDQAIPSNRVGR